MVRHGASSELVKIVAAFLTDRHMSVRVGGSWSSKRKVNGGVPQGSILGVLLFNLTTDNLEDPVDQAEIRSEPATEGEPDLDSSSSSADGEDWMHSTPVTDDAEFEPNITPFRRGTDRFVFFDRARNVKRALSRDPNVTVLRDQTIPDEPNPTTSAVWKPRPTTKHKYIDDGILDTKLNFETVPVSDDGCKHKHAVDTQNVFRRTISNAESIGMRVNTDKTNLLCISDSMSYKAEAYLCSLEGTKLCSSNELKLLGFRFGPRPTCQLQIDAIKRLFRG